MRKVFANCPYCQTAIQVQIDMQKPNDMQAVACDCCDRLFLLTTEIVIKKQTYKVEGL